MERLKAALTNGLFILALYLIVILSVLVTVQVRPVGADTQYLPLESAPAGQITQPVVDDISIERDITQQRLAPVAADELPGSGFRR